MAEGDDQWDLLANGLPGSPAIRAIAIHPERSNTVFVGTQDGPYRTEDHGDHWEKVNVPDHGLPVWSLLFHPRDPNVMFAVTSRQRFTGATTAASAGNSFP